MPGSREWTRLSKSLSSFAESAAKEAGFRRRPITQPRQRRYLGEQLVVQHERLLTGAVTELTQHWATFEGMLLDTQSSGFSDKEVRELRRYATEGRISALGAASSFARVADFNPGIYEPIYDTFREMANIQVEVFDALLRACDSRVPGDLEVAVVSARYCQSLGEQALGMIPELIRQRKQKEKDDERSCIRLGCLISVAILVSFLGLIMLLVLLVTSISCEPNPPWRDC